ncbi:MAG: hypothetical protein AUH14_12440 [Candidatus Rokubacteria bacterium 13_2_20CM_69_15_1]|nr:MAG: hypothetical protein AUH14_12440 [Candidatus Rokubacteria bacterium 13_2_20CM_69_15_1]OLB52663.1 MAG: hypothetical protein AUH99_04580 [Candidatus Rokubacteria bacterium 13_2_20CM_2_70_11]
MIDRFIAMVPDAWRDVAELGATPIAWLPRLQQVLIGFFFDSVSGWSVAAKCVLLLFPVLLGLAAAWCTGLAVYTLPFRSRRIEFVSTILMTWWDAARAVWMYWIGMVRVGAVLVGWLVTLAHLAVKLAFEAARQLVTLPMAVTGRMTDQYFRPGVPWLAFVMLVFWCALEATIFTFTLMPTLSQVLADLAGGEQIPRATSILLWFFLLLLIMGSFACVQALVDAVKKRELKFIIQIVLVEIFVMFFEVMFLYREMVDAITPWIVQQTGDKFHPGLGFTLSVATFGWVGIRGMTWFLFGQYGTPPLLAVISRQPMETPEGRPVKVTAEPAWWREPFADFKKEIGWLHERSDQLLEYLGLPAMHLIAAALNFGMVLVTARPVFSLPFKSLKEVTETREVLAGLMHLQPRRQGAP